MLSLTQAESKKMRENLSPSISEVAFNSLKITFDNYTEN